MPETPQPISQLPAASSAGTTDILPIVQSGTTYRATVAQLVVATNIPALPASKITSGQLALAQGGTHADLSATGGASNVLKQTTVGGNISVAQLAFSDLSGSASAAQLPNPSTTTLGGVEAYVAVSNQFLTSITTAGVPVSAQPAFTNISGSASAAQGGAVGGGAAESQTIGAAIEKKGTALLVAADGSAATVVTFAAAFPIAIDDIQLTVRSTTSATLKILSARPDGAAPTAAAISIQVFGGDAASTASVDWLVKGH